MLLAISACKQPENAAPQAPEPGVTAPPGCGAAGFLKARVYGAISATLDWSGDDLKCEGMPRPEGRGARLLFTGSVGDRSIVIIVAMPELTRASADAELASNITFIEEGGSRFFSTADLDVCITQIGSTEALDDSGDRYSVSGSVYCVSPLAEVNGDSSISLSELSFSGLLDWNAS